MIVLTEKDKDILMDCLKEHEKEMLENGLRIEPVETKTGWIIPETVLKDERCKKLIEAMEKYELKIEIREIKQDELIVDEKPIILTK